MKVVIPYKSAPNNDLYWAVKSIEQNYLFLEEIIIVGDRPAFRGDYSYIPCREERDKEYSIYNKLSQVDGEVLFSNDDIFFINKIGDIPNYYKGACSDRKFEAPYYARMYRNCPAGWKDFDVHCPMVIDNDNFTWQQGLPLKSQYANMANLPGVLIHDFKIKNMNELDRSRPFVSITDQLSKFIEPLLQDMFT